jgi:hypothetical protein
MSSWHVKFCNILKAATKYWLIKQKVGEVLGYVFLIVFDVLWEKE